MRAIPWTRAGAFAAAALAAAAAGACSDFLAAPAEGPARLSVSYAPAPAGPSAQAGPGRAFDRADRLHVRLARGGAAVLDDSFSVSPAGGAIERTVSVPLRGRAEELELTVELRWQGHLVFAGGRPVRLARGVRTSAEVALAPVPAALRIAPAAPFRSLGDTVAAAGAVTFATGDTVPGAAIAWSGPDPGVLEVGADGRMVARAEGQARVVAASGALRAEAVVTVRAAVASVAVAPDSATVMRADSVRFTATARDARGNALARAAEWSTLGAPAATVGPGGVVRGVAPGQAQVRATVEGVAGAGRVRVVPRRGAVVVEVGSAVNTLPLAGVAVAARRGAGATPADPVAATATTGATGRAKFAALDEGPVTLFVSAPGMIDAVVPGVSVLPDQEVGERAVISPVLPPGVTRVVLTWGAAPRDLNAHLTGPNGAGGTFHVHFAKDTVMNGATVIAALDLDDTDRFGPETITLHHQYAGAYCFSVHAASGEAALGASGARVRVFRGSQEVAAFAAPDTAAPVWTVFRMSGSTLAPVHAAGAVVPGVCP